MDIDKFLDKEVQEVKKEEPKNVATRPHAEAESKMPSDLPLTWKENIWECGKVYQKIA